MKLKVVPSLSPVCSPNRPTDATVPGYSIFEGDEMDLVGELSDTTTYYTNTYTQ